MSILYAEFTVLVFSWNGSFVDIKNCICCRLITGFASRNDVERIFKQESKIKTGSFILRFSDNNITDSFGTRSVFGFLTAIVAIKVDTKGLYTYRFLIQINLIQLVSGHISTN